MKSVLKFLFLVAFVASATIILPQTPIADWFDSERLETWMSPFQEKWWGPLVFTGIFILGSLLALPSIGFSGIGGMLYGFFPGIIINLIACNLGANLAFLFSRYFGHDFVKKHLHSDKMHKFDAYLEEHGIKIMIAIRILPILPYNVVNFGSALVKLKYKDYMIGTLIGTFPATLVFTYYSHSLFTGSRHLLMDITVLSILFLSVIGSLFLIPRKLRKL